jgi:hypothetical protein
MARHELTTEEAGESAILQHLEPAPLEDLERRYTELKPEG